MRNHDYAEGLIQEHPIISKLASFLKSQGVPPKTISFIRRHTYFAYPRTLWIKFAVSQRGLTGEEDMAFRHSLDPESTGKALNKWLIQRNRPCTNKVVFDLTGVTIFDAQKFSTLFSAIRIVPGKEKFYIAQGEAAQHLSTKVITEANVIYASQTEMLEHLREVPAEKRCVVPLPKALTMESLERALQQSASSTALRNYDVIAFDMAETQSMSFGAHAMLSPIIHSLGHTHGILATVLRPKSKIIQDIVAHGTLRPMRSNMINVPIPCLQRTDPPQGSQGVFSMRTFTTDEAAQLQALCSERLDGMLISHTGWFANVAGLEDFNNLKTDRTIKRFVTVLNFLRIVLHELVTNVANHAQGLGYLMMELNPQPGQGLRIYIGDTGIGLSRGLSHRYKMQRFSPIKAVNMALKLADMLPVRRRQSGSLAFGGRGLENVGVMLKRLSGTICVRSDNALAKFCPSEKRDPTQMLDNLYFIQGTHIYIKIPTRWEAL